MESKDSRNIKKIKTESPWENPHRPKYTGNNEYWIDLEGFVHRGKYDPKVDKGIIDEYKCMGH